MAGFGDSLAAMDAAIYQGLHDCIGELHRQGRPPRCGLQLIIDHDLEREGAQGIFAADAVRISCQVAQAGEVQRGDVFVAGRKRYTVELIISDDGHDLSAACMVTK